MHLLIDGGIQPIEYGKVSDRLFPVTHGCCMLRGHAGAAHTPRVRDSKNVTCRAPSSVYAAPGAPSLTPRTKPLYCSRGRDSLHERREHRDFLVQLQILAACDRRASYPLRTKNVPQNNALAQRISRSVHDHEALGCKLERPLGVASM